MYYKNLPLKHEFFFKLFQSLDQAMHYCLVHPQNNDQVRKSGYFTLRDISSGRVIITIMLGDIPKEKQEKYLQLSLEKGDRLYKNYKTSFKIFSSWQTRQPDNDKWGGAIRVNRYILSFSGLSELLDEALVLEVALTMNWENSHRLYEISQVSNNIYYRYHNATPAQLEHWKEQT